MDATKLKQIGEEFGQAVRELATRGVVRVGTVESISDAYADIILADGDKSIRVPLQLLKSDSALIKVLPKKDSTVAIVFVEGAMNMPMFIGLTEVEEYRIQVGESTVTVAKDKIEFNGGSQGGLVLIEALTAKLNQLRDEVNRLQTNFLSHTHITPSGPSDAPKATPVSFSPFKSDDYKNDKIIQ